MFPACAFACAVLSAYSQTGAIMIAIDRMAVGTPPDGFNFARTGQGGQAQWTVVADPTAAAGRAIEQTSTATPTIARVTLVIARSLPG